MSNDILLFVPPGPAELKILVLDSEDYWLRLGQMLPNAEFYAMTRHAEVMESKYLSRLNFSVSVADYRRESFPCGEGYFDLVVAETCLEDMWESYDTLMRISRALKDTGSFVGEFLNIRYYKVLEDLKSGLFPYRDKRLYAKGEVVKMLNDAIFKEIDFVPAENLPDETEISAAMAWRQKGFVDYGNELSVPRWLFRAARSTAAAANLKELYTLPVRRQLARLLHRLEYGIDREENLAELKKLCRDAQIFPEYVRDFMAEIVVHPDRMADVAKIFADATSDY